MNIKDVIIDEYTDELEFIYKFFLKYFEENTIQYYNYPEKGIRKLEESTLAYISVEDKINFLTKKHKKIYPQGENLSYYSIYIGDNKDISWERYVNYVLVNSPQFVLLFYERVFLSSERQYAKCNIKNIQNFYNFYQDLVYNYYRDVTELKQISNLLETWSNFYIIKNQLYWIKKKFEHLTAKEVSISNDCTFKEILDDNDYNNLKSKLIDNDIIDCNFRILKQEWPKFSERRMASCIGYLLKTRLKFNKDLNQKNLVTILNNTFEMDVLTEASYSASKKFFERNSSFNNYFDELHFIN